LFCPVLVLRYTELTATEKFYFAGEEELSGNNKYWGFVRGLLVKLPLEKMVKNNSPNRIKVGGIDTTMQVF